MSAFVVSNDRSDGTPNVPNANATGKWRSILWRRNREAGQGTSTSIYLWDEAIATADPLYLKWVPIGNFIATTDLLSLQAASTKMSITSSGGNVYFDVVESALTIANISGDLPLSKLPATVALVDAANTFSLHNTFSNGLTGELTGNATTATAIAGVRDITLTGDATGYVSGVNWATDVTINTTVTHSAVGSSSPHWNASRIMSRIIGNQTPTDGDVYAWDQGNQEWAVTPTHPTALPNLVDVTISSPTDGQLIKYVSSSSDWENFTLDTASIPEGTNLYYTDERVDDRLSTLIQEGTGINHVYDDAANTYTLSVDFGDFTTSNLAEGTNLYYTDSRVRLAVSASSPITYNNSTGSIGWNGTTTDVSEGTNLYYTDARVLAVTLAAATETTAGIVELATTAEATTGTDTVRAVTPAGVQAAVDEILDGAPAALDTLNELAAAIDDDASYASTITTALGTKATKVGTASDNQVAVWTSSSGIEGTSSLVFDGTSLALNVNLAEKAVWCGGYGGGLLMKRSDATSDRYAKLGILDASGGFVSGITVDTAGLVGIGTTAPDALLHVNAPTGVKGVRIDVPTGSTAPAVQIRYDGASKIQLAANGDSYFNGGSLGLGTSVPVAKLDVRGNAHFEGANPNVTINATSSYPYINMEESGTLRYQQAYNVTNNTAYFTAVESGSQMTFSTANTERLRIDSAGNVGISEDSPDFTPNWLPNGTKLSIKGSNNGAIFLERTHASNPRKWGIGITTAGSFAISDDTGNTAPLLISTAGLVGIGTLAPDGTCHIHTGTAGSVTADASANDLIVESSSNCGISLLSPDLSQIYFGTPSLNGSAHLRWTHTDSEFKIGTGLAAGELVFLSGANAERLRITSGGDCQWYNTSAAVKMTWDASAESLGIGTAVPYTSLHIDRPQAGVATLDFEDVSQAAIFIPAVTTSSYYQPLIGVGENATTFTAAISSFDDGSGAAQGLAFHTGDTNAITERLRITSAGNVGIGTAAPSRLLHLSSAGGTFVRFTSEHTNDFSVGVNSVGWNVFNESSGYALVVDGAGNVGIGEDSPQELLHVVGVNDAARILIQETTSDTGDTAALLFKTGTTIADDYVKGGIFFEDDGTGYARGSLHLCNRGSADDGNVSKTDARLTITSAGDITVTGTVDGRDVATDGTKLDAIEASADVTDGINVAAAGAVMESDATTALMTFVKDEDTLSSDSAIHLATQQSIKAYVDNEVAASEVGLLDYKGAYNASTNSPDLDTDPATVKKGDVYTVTVAGTFFSQALEVGDVLIAEQDDPDEFANWTIVSRDLDATSIKTLLEDGIDSVHYVDGSIDTVHLANDAVTGAKIADDALDSEHYTDGSIDTVHLANDAVTGAKIADDAVDSEHYTDGSIDTAHIANLQITTGLIAADAVTGAKIADDAIDSEHYVDGSIDNAHLADNAVSLAKMAGLTRGSVIVGNSSGDPAELLLGSDTYVLTSSSGDIAWAAGGGGGGSGHAIKDEGGSALSTRNNLDFVGELVTATDNSGDDSTDITIDAKTAWLYG